MIGDGGGDAAGKAGPNPYLVHEGLCLSEKGLDRAQFLISPNVGEAIRPLASIASGGELSRVVLALKAILAKTDAVQAIVFDEVDAGIGGEVAEIVGGKLDALARHHQVICITHLPQIAKFGQVHFKIIKKVVKGRTATTILPLDAEARIQELARMLGGVEITDTTLAHAREMLDGSDGSR
jgi:DNA repair protein RecN (Recombination protein N)